MEKIELWKDKTNKIVDPSLFSEKAEKLAKEFANDNEKNKKMNKRTQIRKFYDEVLRLDSLAQNRPEQWDFVLPQVHMLTAKAAYANGRELISDNFLCLVRCLVAQIKHSQDLSVFASFFEALMGFYRLHGPKN
jgi:CRISPR-associated protein Csm2